MSVLPVKFYDWKNHEKSEMTFFYKLYFEQYNTENVNILVISSLITKLPSFFIFCELESKTYIFICLSGVKVRLLRYPHNAYDL